VGSERSMGFQPMPPQAGGLTESSRWLSEALRATPPDTSTNKTPAPRRGARPDTEIETPPHLASLRDATFLNPDFRWYRLPSLAQPPATICQASGLKTNAP